MLHRLQSPDHGLYPRPNLLILLQQRRSLRSKSILALAQGAVFFLELIAGQDEVIKAFGEALELVAERLFSGGSHRKEYSSGPRNGQMQQRPCDARILAFPVAPPGYEKYGGRRVLRSVG